MFSLLLHAWLQVKVNLILKVTQHKCRDVDAVTDVVRRGHGGREDGTLTLGGVSTTEHPTSSLSKLRAY